MAVSWISSGMPAMPKYSQEFPVSRNSCGMPWWTNDGLFVVCMLCKQTAANVNKPSCNYK